MALCAPTAFGLMCKAPRPGFAKSRLAGATGEQAAALLARAFIRDVAERVEELARRRPIVPACVYTPDDAANELAALVPTHWRFIAQRGRDLGERMFRAMGDLSIAGTGVILMGSDVPTVPLALLERAVDALHEPGRRLVLGPAIDGGYFLIGLKAPEPILFSDMAWSTATVLSETLDRAAAAGLDAVVLDAWADIDGPQELSSLARTLAARPDLAPETAASLRRLGLV